MVAQWRAQTKTADTEESDAYGLEAAWLHELKVLHQALRNPNDVTELTPDLFRFYDSIGYTPTSDQAADWTEIKSHCINEVRERAIQTGHLSVDGFVQKVVTYKPKSRNKELPCADARSLVLEPDSSAPELFRHTTIVRIEPTGNHVTVYFADNTTSERD